MNPQPTPNPDGNPSTVPANRPADQRHSAADPSGNSVPESPCVIPSGNQSVLPQVQAAQLEHKMEHAPFSDSIGPLAGGDKSPQTPLQISPPKTAKKTSARRKKRRDNHLSFRAEDDVLDIVAERMALTGESQSDAVRAIIRESQNKAGNIYLAPRTPPEQLEMLLGELKKWRTAFATVKPRLNIATPAADDERYIEVVAWRKEADRLLSEIPNLETLVRVALATLTSLTPEKIHGFRKLYAIMKDWERNRRAKGELDMANLYAANLDLFHDMGIINQEK